MCRHPFATVPNTGGRVDGAPALYVSGWLKRGPSGVILSNINDAAETVAAILEDRAAGKLDAKGVGGGDAVREMLGGGTAPVLGFDSWDRINQLELERGKAAGKVREKIIDVREMLTAAQ